MISLRWVALGLCPLLATACGTVVAGTPRAEQRSALSSGTIRPAQLDDLLTPSGSLEVNPGSPLQETDMQAAMFIGADPADCHGVVAFGRFPLIPTDYTGREARTQVDATNEHHLLEVSAAYPETFDAAAFLTSVRDRVTSCQHPVRVWGDDQKRYRVDPAPLVASAPEVARWSTNLSGDRWICEFSVIALANVISEIVTCSADRSIDNAALTTARLEKISQLLHSTA